jgi:hypothetical protein
LQSYLPISFQRRYLKAKIKPSLIRCVPKMAYFCFIRRQVKHKMVTNFGTHRDIISQRAESLFSCKVLFNLKNPV